MKTPLEFPPHKASMHIDHNQHLAYYRTVAELIAEDPDCFSEGTFESPEHQQRCIDTNEIWQVQWYPNSPVGFYNVAGPTFEETLAYACKVASEP